MIARFAAASCAHVHESLSLMRLIQPRPPHARAGCHHRSNRGVDIGLDKQKTQMPAIQEPPVEGTVMACNIRSARDMGDARGPADPCACASRSMALEQQSLDWNQPSD